MGVGTNPAVNGIGASNHTIRAHAEDVGSRYGIYNSKGRADIDELVKRLGGTIETKDGSESLLVRDKGNFMIYLPRFTSWRRDRFTLAHEIGHYFLHYRFVQNNNLGQPAQIFNRGGRGRAETEANTFAASLLMPEHYFTRASRELDGDIYRLADRFDVSPASAEVRCSVLFQKTR